MFISKAKLNWILEEIRSLRAEIKDMQLAVAEARAAPREFYELVETLFNNNQELPASMHPGPEETGEGNFPVADSRAGSRST